MIDLSKIDTVTPTEYSRYRYIDELVASIRPEVATACDIGCGVGNLLAVLRNHRIASSGIDLSAESIERAKKRLMPGGIKVEKKDVFELNEKVDLAYLSEVLEHVESDQGLLEFLHNNVVNKGGYLIITVPAHNFLYSSFDKSVGHVRRYEKTAMRRLLERSGFEPIAFWSYGSVIFHAMANVPFIGKGPVCRAGELRQRTIDSGMRNFSPFERFFVSRVNIIHRFFYALDYMFRSFDTGIEYCVLCKSR